MHFFFFFLRKENRERGLDFLHPRNEPQVECVWNVMAHAQKPDFVSRRKGRVHLNRQGRQFSLLLAAEVCASAVVMLDTPCSEVVWRVLATHSIRQFPLPCVTMCHHVSTVLYPLYRQLVRGRQARYRGGVRREAISTPITNQNRVLLFISQSLNCLNSFRYRKRMPKVKYF
jgi:hypothetical protein